ncbi:ABC transporter substrate-binding protein [Pararoseomonas indoligenes]|uniref:ABC transporter substrate-binding protein n=1 Tax=Roseomonas indoligenes TaxID=2820811 RepID=A0A940S8Y8_9PROT|nr:ABC transporter substrate-binding protein [Pararoseomonas indoligenes]MBP0494592.1 ABC transporter substrate-binding protein [Pararoseomonas indoligenes]
MATLTRRALGGAALAVGLGAAIRPAHAAEKVTYLFPAPSFLPAFVPHHLAQSRGYFTQEGVEVAFQLGRGGADVAKQVALGNAEIGGGSGDTSMIVRANGLPVRAVALLGGGSLYKIATRKDRNIRSFADLRGKKIGVIAFQDTGYYALLGALAGSGLSKSDVQIQAVGAAGMVQLMVAGSLDGITATPDWADNIESAGTQLDYHELARAFPAMGQAVLTSDRFADSRPAAVRGVVRGIMRGVKACMEDPAAAARDFCKAVPQQAGKEAEIERILRRYVTDVYPPQQGIDLGKFDPARLEKIQKFYMENGVIQDAAPIKDLYSNDFV